MKVYLDDKRTAPPGWTRVRWPSEAIELLKTGNVEALSLDHDLGDDQRGTGYDVLVWLEKHVARGELLPPATLKVHSVNVSARTKMEQAIDSIRRLQQQRSR